MRTRSFLHQVISVPSSRMANPRPKYQVFVSSTYTDLHEEREAVIWQILKSRQIPAGMEAFTAAPDRGWDTIRRVIDTSDYYIVVVAGRYGSLDDQGLSWTEREYDYAHQKGIKTLAFIRNESEITADKMEKKPSGQKKLREFIDKIRNAHLCEQWNNKEDLGALVAQALNSVIRDDEDEGSSPAGWYRGDVISQASLDEFARLSAENSDLREKNARLEEQIAQTQQDSEEAPVVRVLWNDDRIHIEDIHEYTITTQHPLHPNVPGRTPPPTIRIRGSMVEDPKATHALTIENDSRVRIEGIVVDISLEGIAEHIAPIAQVLKPAVLQKRTDNAGSSQFRITLETLDPGNIATIARFSFGFRGIFSGNRPPRAETLRALHPYKFEIHIKGTRKFEQRRTVEFRPHLAIE